MSGKIKEKKEVIHLSLRWLICFIGINIFIAGCKNNEKVPVVPVDVFFGDVGKSEFKISPSGDMVLFFSGENHDKKLSIRKNGSDAIIEVSPEGNKIKSFFWAGDNKVIYTVKAAVCDNQTYIVDVRFCKKIPLQLKQQTKVKFLDFDASKDFVLLMMNERNEELFDVYRVNLNTGEKQLVEKNPGNIASWMTDRNHQIKLAIASNGVQEAIYYKKNGSDKFEQSISYNFRNNVKPIGFSDKEDVIYALSNLGRDKMALVEFNCKTGKEEKLIYENTSSDILDYYYSQKDKKVYFVVSEIKRPQVTFFDEEARSIYKLIKKKLVGQYIELVSNDLAEDKFVIRAYTDKNPGIYYLYDKKTKELDQLGEVNPEIDAQIMCKMEPVTYQAKDGLQIEGFITYPLNVERKKLPVIVIPHSAAFKRRSFGYSAETQFFANRGYVVFEMNYRGSYGYGKDFTTKGFKTWGTALQDDISEGVRYLINQGIADPGRIGIYGYVFGGFCSLNQVIHHPDLYQCAVSYSGLLNLFTYIKDYPAYLKLYESVLYVTVGDPEKDVGYMKYSSPVFQTNKINKPLLVAYGGKDPKVNVNEVNQFVKELRNRKIPVDYMFFDEESQFFNQSKNRIAFYKKAEKFFAKYLKP